MDNFEDNIANYKKISTEVRKKVLEMIYKAQSSHIGSNFSCIDLLTVIFEKANLDKDLKEDRDRIVVSKGWVAAAMYVFLARKGIIPEDDLEEYYKDGSKYIGLAEPGIRGVEAAGGSMGLGLPFGIGFALAKKIKREEGKAFVLMSDGEMDCGTTWESALISSHNELDNLLVVVDANGLQAMGRTKEILDTEPLKNKWEAFGWEAREIDGHNFEEIERAFTESLIQKGKPFVIIARTIKGKGVSFMENNNLYHYKAPSEEEYRKALEELESE
jgi:transketolase